MIPFLIALQFLTTFPISLKKVPLPQQNAQSLLFYPLIGLLIGGILFFVAIIFQALPIILLTSILLVIWIWLTGGLHLDGLADTADAWVGGFGDAEKTLKIMKDPACGPIGVLSLIILCILKWSALYVLLEAQHYTILLFIPILGRLTPLFMFLTTPYVRQKGLGTSIAAYIPKTAAILIFVVCSCASLYFSWAGLIAFIGFLFTLLYLRKKFIQRIGGITGDTIGASIEISECVSLIIFVISLFYISI